jgi:hypothetical protein
MERQDERRPLWKELIVVIAIAIFLIYLIVGGLAYQHGYFDGTVMIKLFPAMAFGYFAAFVVVSGIAQYYPQGIPVWIISGIITFALVTFLEMIDFRWGRRGFGALLALILMVIRIILYVIGRIYNRRSK